MSNAAPLYVQVSKYDNARHVNISGASAVVCLEQLRLAIFGKSLWMRGFNAFLGNLIERFIIAEESRCASPIASPTRWLRLRMPTSSHSHSLCSWLHYSRH